MPHTPIAGLDPAALQRRLVAQRLKGAPVRRPPEAPAPALGPAPLRRPPDAPTPALQAPAPTTGAPTRDLAAAAAGVARRMAGRRRGDPAMLDRARGIAYLHDRRGGARPDSDLSAVGALRDGPGIARRRALKALVDRLSAGAR